MQELHTQDSPLVAGAVVAARGRLWRAVDADAHPTCVAVRLAPIDHAGPAATLLHPFDRLTAVRVSDQPRRTSRRRAAEAAAAALVESHPWTGLRAALTADIHLLPYQLDPALAIVSGQATRILLADDVGLGKTIQAGLILAELRARHELTRALIVTPAGLRDQWERELRLRFDLAARRVDAASLARAGRTLPPWVNPWSLPGLAMASIDLLKRREVCAQLQQTTWDVVVIDEAHHARPGTERRSVCAMVCGRARYVVLITATPHNGDPAAFDALLGMGQLTSSESRMRVFRRARGGVSPEVVTRRTRNVYVTPTGAERRMFATLDRYTSEVWRENERRKDGGDSRLAMVVLRKRALSSAASLARSVSRRIAALTDHEPARGDPQLVLGFEDTFDGELIADDAEPRSVLGAAGLRDIADEHSRLRDLLNAAREAAGVESKQLLLARAVSRAREPVIVFTEYRDTLHEIAGSLGPVGIVQLHGGLLPADRLAAVDAFTTGRARVLVATDAAAEGLNLHHRCRWVVHYELPWNPVRLEQRTGRVDRLGQARRVHTWRLVAAGTDETRVLRQLESRTALSEEQMARLIFQGIEADARSAPGVGHGQGASGSAIREAARLLHLRRLRRFAPRSSLRPLAATVRARGAFSFASHRSLLTVRAVRAGDVGGRRIAEVCWGSLARPREGRSRSRLPPKGTTYSDSLPPEGGSSRTVKDGGHDAGRFLRTQVAIYHAFLRRAIARDEAIAARLSHRSDSHQPSLFDRQALRDAEQRRLAANRCLDELLQHRQRARVATGRTRVSVAVVAIFRIR